MTFLPFSKSHQCFIPHTLPRTRTHFPSCISSQHVQSIISFFHFGLHRRFFKATPTQRTLPRRCCPNPRWHDLFGSGPLPGKQESRCASRCTVVKYQVGIDLHAHIYRCIYMHIYILFEWNNPMVPLAVFVVSSDYSLYVSPTPRLPRPLPQLPNHLTCVMGGTRSSISVVPLSLRLHL